MLHGASLPVALLLVWLVNGGIPTAPQPDPSARQQLAYPQFGPSHQASHLLKVYRKNPVTLFHGCPFDQRGEIDPTSCKYPPSGNKKNSATRLQWKLGIDPELLHRASKEDQKRMRQDLHLLFPALEGGTLSPNSTGLRPEIRGELARAQLYASYLYKIPLEEDQEDRLRLWHVMDPPDTWERDRNSSIEELQGNRNEFIDYPERVERVSDF